MQQTRTKEEKQELVQLYKKHPEPKPADDNLNFVEVKATQEIKYSKLQGVSGLCSIIVNEMNLDALCI